MRTANENHLKPELPPRNRTGVPVTPQVAIPRPKSFGDLVNGAQGVSESSLRRKLESYTQPRTPHNRSAPTLSGYRASASAALGVHLGSHKHSGNSNHGHNHHNHHNNPPPGPAHYVIPDAVPLSSSSFGVYPQNSHIYPNEVPTYGVHGIEDHATPPHMHHHGQEKMLIYRGYVRETQDALPYEAHVRGCVYYPQINRKGKLMMAAVEKLVGLPPKEEEDHVRRPTMFKRTKTSSNIHHAASASSASVSNAVHSAVNSVMGQAVVHGAPSTAGVSGSSSSSSGLKAGTNSAEASAITSAVNSTANLGAHNSSANSSTGSMANLSINTDSGSNSGATSGATSAVNSGNNSGANSRVNSAFTSPVPSRPGSPPLSPKLHKHDPIADHRGKAHKERPPMMRSLSGNDTPHLLRKELKATIRERLAAVAHKTAPLRDVQVVMESQPDAQGHSRRRTYWTCSDDSGRFSLVCRAPFLPKTVHAYCGSAHESSKVLFVPQTGISVISDIDDTIRHTGVTRSKRELLQNVFAKSFEDCKLDGVSEWYNKLAAEGAYFHYVSNSPWQLYDVIYGFLRYNNFPEGSIHLKRYAGVFDELTEPARMRKRKRLEEIVSNFPKHKFILVGDSGEADLESYADLARRFPKQVVAIYIRNVEKHSLNGVGGVDRKDPIADLEAHTALGNLPQLLAPQLVVSPDAGDTSTASLPSPVSGDANDLKPPAGISGHSHSRSAPSIPPLEELERGKSTSPLAVPPVLPPRVRPPSLRIDDLIDLDSDGSQANSRANSQVNSPAVSRATSPTPCSPSSFTGNIGAGITGGGGDSSPPEKQIAEPPSMPVSPVASGATSPSVEIPPVPPVSPGVPAAPYKASQASSAPPAMPPRPSARPKLLRRTSSKIMEGLTTVKSAARMFPHFESSPSHTHENAYRRKPQPTHHLPSAHQSAYQATHQGPHHGLHPSSHTTSHSDSQGHSPNSSYGSTLRVSPRGTSHSHSASHNSQNSSGSSSSSKSAHSPTSSQQHIDDDLFVPSSQEFDFDRIDGERVTKRSDLWKYRMSKQRRNLPEGFELKTWRKPEEVEKESLDLVEELKAKINK